MHGYPNMPLPLQFAPLSGADSDPKCDLKNLAPTLPRALATRMPGTIAIWMLAHPSLTSRLITWWKQLSVAGTGDLGFRSSFPRGIKGFAAPPTPRVRLMTR